MSLLVPDNVIDVTLSDTVGNEKPAGVLYVGTAGDLKVGAVQSGIVTFKNIPNGTWLRIRCKTVYTTGSTASDIIKAW